MSDIRVCIIGAGSSGITVAKALQERAIAYDCYEKSDQIGGNWVFKNNNGMSSAYRSLHINTSREKMAYADFPMPDDYPDYPHHELIARYFNDYVDHFGIRKNIKFENAVTRVVADEDGLWRITSEDGRTQVYDALVVANGHHWDPRYPDPAFPGSFDGQTIHSHHYIDPTDPIDMRNKNVLIVGFGNSALDLACELGRKGVTKSCLISMRRGYWVLPRYFGSQVLDHMNPHPATDPPLWMRLLPDRAINFVLQKRIEAITGRPEDHGLPKPDPFGTTHPAISHDIYNRIGSGDVEIRSNIKALHGDKVAFVDGSEDPVDIIIWCTGYKITFPFFHDTVIDVGDNDVALWKRMMMPEHNNLFFVGLVQPLCAMMPIAEQQGIFIAEHLIGRNALPSTELMARERDEMHRRIKSGYINSPRHTIQINCADYTRDLRKQLKRGAKMANKHGNPKPTLGAAKSAPAL